MSALRVAVIGTGYFAGFHYDAWARMPEVSLSAQVTLDLEAGAALADEFDVAYRTTDIDAMLQDVKPQIVDIVSPPSTHLDMIRRIAPTGAAIQCQKPFCASYDDALEAVQIAEDHGTVLAVHENFRFQPWHRKIKDLLNEQTLGDVYQATFRLRPGDGQGDSAYLDRQPYFREMTHFLIRETAIHQVDLFRYFFGTPGRLFASLQQLNPVIAGEDAGMILFDFPNGERALFDGNRLVDHAAENTRRTMGDFIIEGSKASLRLDGDARLWLRKHGARNEAQITFDWDDRHFAGDCVYKTTRAFLDHLVADGPLENAARDYVINRQIEDAIYRSNDEGRWVALGDL